MTEHEEQGRLSAAGPAQVREAPMLSQAGWVRTLPFASYMFFIFVYDVLARLGFAAHELRWLYPVKIGVVAILLALFWRHFAELRNTSLRLSSALVAAGTGVVVLVLWVTLNAPWMSIGTAAGFDPHTDGAIDWWMVAVRVSGAVLVVPVMEELFWRSFLLRWIKDVNFETVDPARVTALGLVLTVALFGIEHTLWLAGMVAGLAYSLLYMRHRSLWSPILAHAVTNGLLSVWIIFTGSWTYW